MALIASYLNDRLVSKQTDAIVDETLVQLRTRSNVLGDAAPVKEYSSRNFLGLLANDVNPVASLVAYGQEIPTVGFGEFKKVTAEMAKIGVSRLYDENLQWQMYEAMQLANLKGVTVQDQRDANGNVVNGANNDLAMFLFGSVKKLVMSVMDRADSMTWQVLQTGGVDLGRDPRTQMNLRLDYKNPLATYNHFPGALIAKGNADGTLNRWSDYEHANGIQVLYNAIDNYIDTNGFPPDYIVMSRKLHNHLMQQKSTKDAATSVRGSSVGTVSVDMLNSILEARGIPNIKIVDDRYNLEDENKNIINARFLNDNTFVFIKKESGIRAIGVTMESSSTIVGDGSMPMPKTGVYVLTHEKQKQPPLDETLTVMTFLPVFLNPKLLYAQTVN